MNNETASCDLLIKGGLVIDPANSLFGRYDVALKDGLISAVGESLNTCARSTIDAAGLIVTPGLIDMHCHCYPFFPLSKDSLPNINPDAHMFSNGVTTAVDAGTCGTADFISFRRELIERSRVRILAFINIARGGMVHMDTEQDFINFDPTAVAKMANDNRDLVVGIKTAHYWVGKPFDDEHPAWGSIDSALEAGALSGLPCMIDFQPTLPERSYQGLLQRLRSGDIHTHVYAKQFPILDEAGAVNRFLFLAKERGIVFDLGHGAGSFMFKNAIPAFEQGFWPDTLSTDLYLDNVSGPVFGLIHILSKYLSMGMPLLDVITRATVNPARVIGRPKLGTLTPGSEADVSLLREVLEPVRFADSSAHSMAGDRRLTCHATIRQGELVYNPYALTLPDWESGETV